jgi:hypothetical protein
MKKYKTIEEKRKAKNIRERERYHKNLEYRKKILKHQKEYYQIHKKEKLEQQKKYRINNEEKIKKYEEKRKERKKQYLKEYRQKNREKLRVNKRKYENNKLKTNIDFKLALLLRDRLRKAIKNGYKAGSTIKDLGCSIPELKLYLESIFQRGMSWDNYGVYGWHIDHIIPLKFFNLSNREEFLKACHYTNLQPLWSKENIRKGDKYAI